MLHGASPFKMEKTISFLWTIIIITILLPFPRPVWGFGLLAVEHDWNVRLGLLRAEALDRLFPRLKTFLEAIDPFGVGFVDYRDPYELISYITLYLPAVIFMINVLFHSIPHVLNFLLFIPKLWFFNLPCLYSFKTADSSILLFNEVATTNPCDSVNLAHITQLVYKGLVKLTEQQ